MVPEVSPPIPPAGFALNSTICPVWSPWAVPKSRIVDSTAEGWNVSAEAEPEAGVRVCVPLPDEGTITIGVPAAAAAGETASSILYGSTAIT